MANARPTKSKIVINTFGSLGDLYPYLAISRELKQRGYDPVLAASESLREFIESVEIKFEPIRPNPEKDFSRTELVERTFRLDNAARVERLGVGKTLFLKNYQSDKIVLTLTKILNNQQLLRQASTGGAQIKQENGVAQSCDLIEKFLSGH